MVSTVTGLVSCGLCNNGKRYTPKGLDAHLTLVHRRRICPRCHADITIHREIFGTRHNCAGAEELWPYPDGEGTRQ